MSVSLSLAALYLLLGFLASYVMRKGRPEDWDESLLASIVALPAVILIAAAVLIRLAWKRLGGSGPTAHA